MLPVKPSLLFLAIITLFLFCIVPLTQAEASGKDQKAFAVAAKQWRGDLDGMIKRRQIRVLVTYNNTTYFVDKGVQRGINYDVFRQFEDQLNAQLKNKHIRVNVVFVPVARDQLLPALIEGLGDVAAANLTMTADRHKLVDFTEPLLRNVKEIVVTGPQSPSIDTLDDLAGRTVFVRRSSSYYESLVSLNTRFKEQGKAEVVFQEAPENLEDEDLLEMLQAGLVETVVVDDHKARFWKQVFPQLTLHEDIAVRSGGDIAWAIRKNSPQLQKELNAFIAKHRKGTAFGNEIFRRYLQSVKYVKNAANDEELKKFRNLLKFFQQYGDQYNLDWILMAAQGYQESRLDQTVKSKVGAIGVMQVMPATGKELDVGDIRKEEPNIHAGVKYIRFMIDQYFKDEPMTDLNKGLFAFASYNAGPARIRSLRKEASKRGLNPNVWFNSVELLAAEKIGRETVTYVSNIYKYYIAYSLVQQQDENRKKAKESLQKTEQ
jgi:membrane-bound lytic murein transglycosylase MltF